MHALLDRETVANLHAHRNLVWEKRGERRDFHDLQTTRGLTGPDPTHNDDCVHLVISRCLLPSICLRQRKTHQTSIFVNAKGGGQLKPGSTVQWGYGIIAARSHGVQLTDQWGRERLDGHQTIGNLKV
jgi:hypothetical protein